ncbi:MAG: type II toxin-antitoxin system death-on-curing family toxin [Deltaproteobacteria bacterium]|nr:type II toxin-antitoxin system death-on-curing family toxin [Deltaproteobacteria bacterium]
MRPIKISEVEHIAHNLARKHLEWDEPIPDFETRYPGILESCLGTVFQTFGGKDLYPTLIDKASMLFYLMVKNHPFLNGNKRIALTTLVVFLVMNNKWLDVQGESFYQTSIEVAESNPKYRESVIKEIKSFIRSGLTNLNRN